jgi:hypothetical protein
MRALHSIRAAGFAVVAALCACAAPSQAAEIATTDVEISRITLKLPGNGWTVSGPMTYGVSVSSSPVTVGGQSRLVVSGPQGSREELVMLVSATRGERGVTLHAECEPQDGMYVRKFNRGQSNYIPLQCLRVQGPVLMPSDPAVFGEEFAAAMAAQHAVGPVGGYAVFIDVCNENGAIVEITALIGTQFAGLDAKPAVARVPDGMPPAVVAWADKLAESALETLSSWSARLSVPPVVFSPPAPADATMKTAFKD